VFYTSAAILVLEILAGRLMAPYVGVSLETFTGIIGAILAGIALGSAVGGRLADRRPPEQLLGPTLVLGGALSALAIPIIAVVGPGMSADPISIVLLASLSFVAPTTVISAVSPMVAKLQLDDLGDTGRIVGSLSAAGTFGALAGTFVTGFVLVSAVATRPIVLGVAASLVAVGLYLWVRLAGVRPHTGIAAVVLAVFGLGANISGPCDAETAYACIDLVEDPAREGGRSLYLDGLRHSYVDLDDPTYLEFRYFRMFADVATVLPPGSIDALSIGGAGFAFPRYLEATRPGTSNLILEIDGALVDFARDELGLVLGPDMEVRIGDARVALRDLESDSFDLIVGDAFSGRSVPWHLTTTEVMAELDRALRPDGLLMMNVIDGGENRFARAELATLGEHFDHLGLIAPPADTVGRLAQNLVLIASDAPLGDIDVDPLDGVLVTGQGVVDFIDDARILTDDFAPADQLTADF
jgi:SAM-dependent methyltransferase